MTLLMWAIYGIVGTLAIFVERKYELKLLMEGLKSVFPDEGANSNEPSPSPPPLQSPSPEEPSSRSSALFDRVYDMKKTKLQNHYFNLSQVKQERVPVATISMLFAFPPCHRQQSGGPWF